MRPPLLLFLCLIFLTSACKNAGKWLKSKPPCDELTYQAVFLSMSHHDKAADSIRKLFIREDDFDDLDIFYGVYKTTMFRASAMQAKWEDKNRTTLKGHVDLYGIVDGFVVNDFMRVQMKRFKSSPTGWKFMEATIHEYPNGDARFNNH